MDSFDFFTPLLQCYLTSIGAIILHVPYDCPNDNAVMLKAMGKIKGHQTTTNTQHNQNYVHNSWGILEICH